MRVPLRITLGKKYKPGLFKAHQETCSSYLDDLMWLMHTSLKYVTKYHEYFSILTMLFFRIRKCIHFIDALQLLYILPNYAENTENTSYFVKPKTNLESKDNLCFTQWTLFLWSAVPFKYLFPLLKWLFCILPKDICITNEARSFSETETETETEACQKRKRTSKTSLNRVK